MATNFLHSFSRLNIFCYVLLFDPLGIDETILSPKKLGEKPTAKRLRYVYLNKAIEFVFLLFFCAL